MCFNYALGIVFPSIISSRVCEHPWTGAVALPTSLMIHSPAPGAPQASRSSVYVARGCGVELPARPKENHRDLPSSHVWELRIGVPLSSCCCPMLFIFSQWKTFIVNLILKKQLAFARTTVAVPPGERRRLPWIVAETCRAEACGEVCGLTVPPSCFVHEAETPGGRVKLRGSLRDD